MLGSLSLFSYALVTDFLIEVPGLGFFSDTISTTYH